MCLCSKVHYLSVELLRKFICRRRKNDFNRVNYGERCVDRISYERQRRDQADETHDRNYGQDRCDQRPHFSRKRRNPDMDRDRQFYPNRNLGENRCDQRPNFSRKGRSSDVDRDRQFTSRIDVNYEQDRCDQRPNFSRKRRSLDVDRDRQFYPPRS